MHIYIRMDAHLELDSSSEQVQLKMGAVHMGRSESYPANIVEYCRLVHIADSSILSTRYHCEPWSSGRSSGRLPLRSSECAAREEAPRSEAGEHPSHACDAHGERETPPARELRRRGGVSAIVRAGRAEAVRLALATPATGGEGSEGRVREGEIRARLLVGMVND